MAPAGHPVEIRLLEESIQVGDDLHGIIKLSYDFRFDTIVINSQIEDSTGTFEFTELNGRSIDYPYARLSIFAKDISGQNEIGFTARTNHVPSNSTSNCKFRVSIIQEHKEIASDISYVKLSR